MGDQDSQPGDAANELRNRLAPTAAQMGLRVPVGEGESSDDKIVPEVNLAWPIGKKLGRELGQLISRGCGIYRMGDRIVTVDELTGKTETMTSVRFGSWLEHWVETVKYDRFGELRPVTMGDALAKQVMAADQFRFALRELKGVHPVRMPVLRDKGKRVELLKPGFDEESGIFTCESIRYPTDMPIEEAFDVFHDILKSYPFADLGPALSDFRENRSVAVHVAMTLGNFCRGFFGTGVLRPMAMIIGNQPGTGKGTLAQGQLIPIYGLPKIARKPKDDAEFDKLLDTQAIRRSPYYILDDIGAGLYSNALNAFITEPIHSGRKMGGQEEFEAPNVTQVIATGNQIKTTRDLERRSLIIELHLAGEVEGRVFDQLIDPLYLSSPEVRKRVLAALWAMVRTWSERGCVKVTNVKPTFERWTEVIGAIVRGAGFGDPLQKPELGAGGDEESQAWKEFLGMLAGECMMPGEDSRDFTIADMLKKIEEWEDQPEIGFSMDDLVGAARDQNKAFGRRLAKWKGREILDTQGRLVQFGNRRQAKKRVYPCTVVAAPAPTSTTSEASAP